MSRYLAPLLRRIFKPVSPMEAQTDVGGAGEDPIAREIDEALSAHESASQRERDNYDSALAAINEVLQRFGSNH